MHGDYTTDRLSYTWQFPDVGLTISTIDQN